MDQTSIDQSGRLVRVARFPRLRTLAWSGDHLYASPAENPNAIATDLGEYFMLFAEKADYQGFNDSSVVPQLDYRGTIGLQYNPIAIAQYGLGNYNQFCGTADTERRRRFFVSADWLCSHLERTWTLRLVTTSLGNTATLSVPRGARLRLRFPQIFPVSRLKPR
jgi:hypothetical protein